MPKRQIENFTGLATSRGSTQERDGAYWMNGESAHLAVDDDQDASWNPKPNPTQWFSFTFDHKALMHPVEMVVAQPPAGPKTHVRWIDDESAISAFSKRSAAVQTIVVGATCPGNGSPCILGTYNSADFCTSLIRGIRRSKGDTKPGNMTAAQGSLSASAGTPVSGVGIAGEGNLYFTVHAKNYGAIAILADKSPKSIPLSA